MKLAPTTFSKVHGASLSATPASKEAGQPTAAELGFVERRKVVRTLPVPLAVESEGDTDWDIFQSLISDPPKN